MERLVLLIDNEKQDTNEEKIVREGKGKGLSIKTMQFNVGHPELTDVLDKGKINIPKVIEFYKTNFKKFHFDLIAFDWSLDDAEVDGVKLIQQFRANDLLKKTNIVLYSGELPDAVKGYFESYRKNQRTFKENWAKIKTLIDIPILGFFDRANYEEEIVKELVSISKHIHIEHDLIKKLRENSDLIFNNINPRFEGMTFGKVADIIENDIKFGHHFTSEFIDQALALMFKLNS